MPSERLKEIFHLRAFNMKTEIWKDVKGYEGLYQVSNFGKVINLKRNKEKKPELLKGYLRVSLYKNGLSKHYFVHRLVAINFIDNKDNKPQVNHIDGNALNNNVSNLEWNTSKENINHSYNIGNSKIRKGEETKINKITEEQAKIIVEAKKNSNGKRYWGLKQLCFNMGINYGIGCEISKGNNWKHLH